MTPKQTNANVRTEPVEAVAETCCTLAEQQTCCEPADKAACCGKSTQRESSTPSSCGCR
jgi:hypothetical protein